MAVWKWGVAAFAAALGVGAYWFTQDSPTPPLAPPEPRASYVHPVPRVSVASAPALVPASGATGPRKVADDIGSEGYGPHIVSIAASGSSSQALVALGWIKNCNNNERLIENALRQRAKNGERGGLYKGILAEAEVTGRRCQTVTPEIAALSGNLALLAMKGNIEGAASTYVGMMQSDPSPELRAALLEHLQKDAQDGDLASAIKLGGLGNKLKLSAAERVNYVAAMSQFSNFAPLAKVLNKQLANESAPAPDPAVVSRLVNALNARYSKELGSVILPANQTGG